MYTITLDIKLHITAQFYLLQDEYQEELSLMIQSGHRAEIEALYYRGYDFLGKYLAKKIVQANYI